MATDEFGAYLLSRRAATRPEDVGIPSGGYRRVQGLRREEVAVLAGVSVDYYARLEQGRERHPSPQVLEALSRTFNLDRDAKEHLCRLARISPTVKGYTWLDTVSPDLLRLMDNWPATPAYACVANLRLAAGHDPHDPRLAELLAELRGNAEFRAIWDSGEVRGKSHGAKEFHHPEVGRLRLNYQVFDVRSAPGQQLTVYQAEPGSPARRR